MNNILRYILDIRIFLLPVIGLGIGPKNPILVGAYKRMLLSVTFTGLCTITFSPMARVLTPNATMMFDADVPDCEALAVGLSNMAAHPLTGHWMTITCN